MLEQHQYPNNTSLALYIIDLQRDAYLISPLATQKLLEFVIVFKYEFDPSIDVACDWRGPETEPFRKLDILQWCDKDDEPLFPPTLRRPGPEDGWCELLSP